jgi:hypothetical protein
LYSYCAHWSFTSPLAFEDAADLASDAAGSRNVEGAMYDGSGSSGAPALTDGSGDGSGDGGGEALALTDGSAADGSAAPADTEMADADAADADGAGADGAGADGGGGGASSSSALPVPPPLLELGDDAEGRGALMSWQVRLQILDVT